MSQSYSSSGGWWRVHEYQTTTPPFDLANYSYLDPICFLYTAWCLGALPDCLYFPILTCRGRNSASKRYLYHGRDGSGRNCSLSVGSGSGTQLTRMLLHPWLLKQSLFWHQMLEPKLRIQRGSWITTWWKMQMQRTWLLRTWKGQLQRVKKLKLLNQILLLYELFFFICSFWSTSK